MQTPLLMILTAVLVIGLAQFSYAELVPGAPSVNPYPYVDPIREYYDNKQAEFGIFNPPATVYYNAFSVEVPPVAQCGWLEITGQVPYAGLVTVQVFTHDLEVVATANINSNPAQLLRGYVDMPCSVEPTGYWIEIEWMETPFKINGLDKISYQLDRITLDILIN